MKNLMRSLAEDHRRKKRYFREAEQEIAENNLHLLIALSLVAICLLVFFYVVTPFILEGWQISLHHILFFPAMVCLFLMSLLYRRSKQRNSRLISAMCLLFGFVLFTFSICIDVLPDPNAPCTFLPLLFVAMPVLFVLPLSHVYVLISFFEVVFVNAVLMVKAPFFAQYDIFASVVGLVFSIPLAMVMMRLRVRDYEVRMKYQQLSIQDSLAGLLNKGACESAITRYLAHCQPTRCTLLILDVDNFKHVNDKSGHYTGDVLLRAIGQILTDTFRATDIIGRCGGDEFMILVKDTADPHSMEEKCQRIQEKLSQVALANHDTAVTCSIGGLLVDGETGSFEELYRLADEALYHAKDNGKNQHVLWTRSQRGPGNP